jgi:hypothetical protein
MYIRDGGSIHQDAGGYSHVIAVVSSSSIASTVHDLDTFICSNLTFDYSEVTGVSSDQAPKPIMSISQLGTHLLLSEVNSQFVVRIFNILGNQVMSDIGSGDLDLDLTPLPPGVYFAEVTAGGQRAVRRIVR